ncbi:MAG: hypothetical protein E6J65_21665 [Deltaproteobacteria bacterium]|nr:MAG: hypothetical protein E6J65_21665 [Deltaproteobacteria bacterium]
MKNDSNGSSWIGPQPDRPPAQPRDTARTDATVVARAGRLLPADGRVPLARVLEITCTMRARTWDLPLEAYRQRSPELQFLSFGRDGLTLDLLDDESGKPRKNRIHVPGFALGYRAGAVHKDFMVTLSSLVGSVVLAGVLKNGQTIRIVRRGRPRHRRSEHD